MRISDWSSDVCSSDLKNLKAFCFGGSHALVERLRGGGVAPGQGGGVEWQQGQGNNGGKRGPAGQSDDKGVHEEQGLRREATRRDASWRGARQPRALARLPGIPSRGNAMGPIHVGKAVTTPTALPATQPRAPRQPK